MTIVLLAVLALTSVRWSNLRRWYL